MRSPVLRIAALASLLPAGSGCGRLLLHTCGQRTGKVTTLSGEAAPGAVVSHQVAFGTNGEHSQYVRPKWTRQSSTGGPGVKFYATRDGCVDFRPPPSANTAACSVLGSAGSIAGRTVSWFQVTRGAHDADVGSPASFSTSGSSMRPASYKVWVVGDPTQASRYTVDITWRSGPDC